jgi:sortase A
MRNQSIPRKSPLRRWIEALLLTAALLGIGVWAVGTAYPVVWQKWANWAFDRERAQKTATIGDLYRDLQKWATDAYRIHVQHEAPEETTPEAEATPPLVLKTREFAGRVTIPRLHMQMVVREGADSATLAMAAGHIPGTAMPGQPGNVGIAGHRDTLLRGLGAIRLHDRIEFDAVDGKQFLYEVESTSIHSPKDVYVLNAADYPQLTLVTCYPFDYIGSAPKRFIVKARQLGIGKTTPPLILAKYEVKTPPAKKIAKPAAVSDDDPDAMPKKSGRIYFTLDLHRTRRFGHGISLGLSDIDEVGQAVTGWVSIATENRVVWLRDQRVDDPFVFYGGQDGARGVVVITAVHEDKVSGWFEVAGA